MTNIRAQVILQGGSGLPEDRFVNVWHFNVGPPDLAGAADLIHPAIEDFYQLLQAYYSEYVSTTVEVRYYLMSDPEPRVPETRTFTWTLQGTPVSLPAEVACVMSIHGDPPVTPRRRGRLYLGPLNVSAQIDGTTLLPARVSDTFATNVATAADGVLTAAVGWSIWSPTSSLMVAVTAGFVDNAWDTQRRRGVDATSRILFPIP